MRELADVRRIRQFMQRLGARARSGGAVFFTGGVTALLHGWRPTTLDIDLSLSSDAEPLLPLLPALKEELHLNVELASPADFIPELPGWRERCRFIEREGPVDFFHYDFYAQALAKIERGHAQDRADVESMLAGGLVLADRVLELFDAIEAELYRYPALDPATFRRAVIDALAHQP